VLRQSGLQALTETGERVDSINIHGAATANTFSTAPSEGKRRINLILDSDQGV
jgi:hypothetical protein